MLSREAFIRASLEVNLFFQRIMKEHLFFIETNLQPVEAGYIAKANALKQSFEQLLAETTTYANGNISEKSIRSNQFVTPYTLKAEVLNSRLTGGNIDTDITRAQLELTSNSKFDFLEWLESIVSDINTRSINLLEEVLAFQKKLMDEVLECEIFITLYPEMLEHDTREAIYYLEILKAVQDRKILRKALCDELNFWNNIMSEHAQFIDGMLDPTEKAFKETAETTAEKFEMLVKECIDTAERQILQRSSDATEGIIDYKKAATVGLLECEIKSIIPPLLADHVLREANHYQRLLGLYTSLVSKE